MRNYVFVKNDDAKQRLEELVHDDDVIKSNVDLSYNRKGMVIKFRNAHFAEVINMHIEDERNEVAFALTVEPYQPMEKKRAQNYVRSLTRISNELLAIVTHYKKQAN